MSPPLTIFTWPRRQRSSWALVGCIFLSLMLHSAPFFLFQTAPPRLTPPPRTAYPVQLLTSFGPDGTRSEENEELLRWVDANDPAIIARMPRVEPKGLLDVPFRPSFATPRTPPLDVPPTPATVKFPPARDPLALIRSAEPRPPAPEEPVVRQSTSLAFSETLARRAPAAVAYRAKGKSAKPVKPTLVMLGVTPAGEVRFKFIQDSSGEPPLDLEALDYLSALRFAPATSLQWGTVRIYWGDEIAE